MNRPPEPSYTAPTPNRKETRHRQADLYDYNMETEGARIHVEVWLHEIIHTPQYSQVCVVQQRFYCLPVLRPVHFAVASFIRLYAGRSGGAMVWAVISQY